MMSLWDALRMNMMISYQELVRTFPKAFLFKRKPGYKAHYRFTRALISIALRNIQLFNMQLTAVSGRGIKNIATCQASNVIAAARSDHQGTGKPVE